MTRAPSQTSPEQRHIELGIPPHRDGHKTSLAPLPTRPVIKPPSGFYTEILLSALIHNLFTANLVQKFGWDFVQSLKSKP